MSSKGSPERKKWRMGQSLIRVGRRNSQRGAEEHNPHVARQAQRQGRRAHRAGWSWSEVKDHVNRGFLGGHRTRR